ncbi:GntR family transcriptional regulator [Rhodococcus wratislaviensis]|uniref:Putative GntR family transcriptional regulator n=1 Tax=Rhodococcus wratislaviensis NBRC 100605 TaxID=1219028 RepID=X0R7D2_RHOWR|nr:GntR family transcriptional regulator [Rhodococcus wratislaviensis]GAF46885.1 putative GntR family transcriptional regulator [Rhodococcus wratislaviensis NBRC 100605]
MTEVLGTYRVARSAAPVREQAVIQLRNLVAGRFQPGERVIEATVCELLGTSRTTVREALRQLETEGLIEIVPGKGPTVARVDESDIRDLYEIREVLESFAIMLFTERATADEKVRLASAFGDLEKASASGEATRVLEAKQVFYDVLFEGAHNNSISVLSQSIYYRVARVRLASLSAERIRAGIEELRIVHQFMAAGSGQEAQDAYAVHMQNAREAAVEAVKRFN